MQKIQLAVANSIHNAEKGNHKFTPLQQGNFHLHRMQDSSINTSLSINQVLAPEVKTLILKLLRALTAYKSNRHEHIKNYFKNRTSINTNTLNNSPKQQTLRKYEKTTSIKY